MLRTIQMLEYINKNQIDLKGYANFLTVNQANISIRDEDGNIDQIKSDNFKSLITQAFIEFNKFEHFDKNKLKKITDYNDILNYMTEELVNIVFYTSQMVSLVEYWNVYKQVYKFDKDALELLEEQKENLDIKLKVLKNLKLPYDVFFIENEFNYSVSKIETILIGRSINSHDELQLSILLFKEIEENGKKYISYLPIIIGGTDEKTVRESLELEGVENSELIGSLVGTIINLLMYLSQPKAEILKKSPLKLDKKTNDLPKSFYGINPTENEVGYHLGNSIRKYKYSYLNKEKKEYQGGTKKPHMRGGHFHHYWVGKGRNDLIVKFVEPTFVLGGNKDLPTLHKVKK